MRWLIFVLILFITQGVGAEPIYKSIDKHGNVTYSSKPLKGATEVESVTLPPPPSPEEVERAKQRYLDLEARDAEREVQRQEEEREKLLQRQIQTDLELKRELASRKPPKVYIINQNPYYWGRPFHPAWGKRSKSTDRRVRADRRARTRDQAIERNRSGSAASQDRMMNPGRNSRGDSE